MPQGKVIYKKKAVAKKKAAARKKAAAKKTVPPLALDKDYKIIGPEVSARLRGVLASGCYVLGPQVKEFERAFAEFTGAKFAIGVASGSDALLLSLMVLGIGAGDEVITTPATFFATVGSIVRAGAKPVFADIERETYGLDPALIEEKITSKTKAIVPVHLYGQPCQIERIAELAGRRGLALIEDACQAHGAAVNGKKAGTFGRLAAFSFYPTKNLGAFGDGGAITTDSAELAEKLACLRAHGAKQKYYHEELGINSRLDEMQAAVLNVKLSYLNRWTKRRIELAANYDRLLARARLKDVVPPPKVTGSVHVYHQYVLVVKDRDKLLSFLQGQGIGAGTYYPLTMHEQSCLAWLGYRRGDFPEAERLCGNNLALPIYPALTFKEQELVARKIKEFYS